MPKIVKTPKTRREINEASMARRGIVTKSFKMPETSVQMIKQLSETTGKSQTQLITEAIELLCERYA
ncbi:ribbon-helix-helix domain-containing protein [Moraxella marmotae]|uniref:ribbon-helix-helix domain-containing protein n=1 Tax=Moraxella marmotae TaxID=3344520 RepID=UPI0035D481D7